ncbi:hypothetical protein V6617_10245 [Pelagibacterium nitratireducens]|uniref:Uncharacterized protein n=1 Tax=Pelagibacterium nitratireducens TaxID=1046114 RepID=A0ABZ2HWS2_9HYPH
MKGIPRRGPNPMEPLNRAIIDSARAQALFNVALWLALNAADTPERRMSVLGLLDGIATGPRTWDPFPIDYDPATGDPAPADLAHEWKFAAPPADRIPLNALARSAITEDIKALREFIANPPPEWDDEA